MTTFISRDYSPATTGYTSQPFGGSWGAAETSRVHVNVIYQLSLFLNKILGYSIVGQTNWDINNTNIKSLAITLATNTIPIQVTTGSAHGLIDGYVVSIAGGTGNIGVNGTWKVNVINSTQFTLSGSYGTGTYTASSATMTTGFQYASGMVVDGYGAGINFGAGFFFEVSIPITKRAVVASDIGRILVLKSTAFPTKNAGLFKISGINTAGGVNRYIIDYRSTENPPIEAANSIDWWLYETEAHLTNASVSGYLSRFIAGDGNPGFAISSSTNATPIVITTNTNFPHTWMTGQKITITGHAINTNANGTWTITQINATQFSLNGSVGNGIGAGTGTAAHVGYPGSVSGGSADPHSRVILQSPHSSAWQVRLAAEPGGGNLPRISITVGYGGNSSGDFPASALITNVAQYLDINPIVTTSYINTIVGAGHSTISSRMSMVGDGYGQFVCVYTRASGANNGFLTFGIPDNEPVLTSNTARLFCYGAAPTTDFGTIRLRTGATTNVGNSNANGVPELCALTSWANLDGTSATNPMLSSNAGDSPFTNTTEILPIEIWGGVTADIALSTSVTLPFSYNTRFMGIAPALRNGRNNFGDFTISTDEVTARTVTAATNASPIQITTSAANALTTGQTVTISGVTGNTAANGTWVITAINTTNFTLTGSAGNGAYVSGGTVNGCARWLHLQNGIYLQWNGASGLTP
jgi:hypothetical protein